MSATTRSPSPIQAASTGSRTSSRSIGNFFNSVFNFFRENFRAILQIAVSAALNFILPFSGVLLAVASAAGGAAIATGLTGGNLSQVLRAGLIAGATAFAFFEVGSATNAIAGVDPSAAHIQPAFGTPEYAFNVGGHALVGCGASVASGGSCQSGALAGAAGSAAGPALTDLNFGARLVATAVLGGVASVAGGGKFANGAVTGAFGYLFNELGTLKQRGYSFDSTDGAAYAALSLANPRSIADNLEYGGLVYQQYGEYSYTAPIQGSDRGFDPNNAVAPDNANVVGDYHTHGDYSILDSSGASIRTSDPTRDWADSDNFSPADINGTNSDARGVPGYNGYLGTPSGQFKFYNPATGIIGVLR